MKKTAIILLVSTLTGCSGIATMNQDFMMTGSAEGIKQFYTGLNGTIKEGKQSADAPSEYLAFRSNEEREITKRNGQLSFWDKLVGNSDTPMEK